MLTCYFTMLLNLEVEDDKLFINHIWAFIQFYLLLSPYLCFISFLYLNLYVLGDDAFIS